jgi:hypothetical protein
MWHFREHRPGDPTRDPIVGEFFSTDAITNPAEALVREGIQNSLDAGRPSKPIRIRLALRNEKRGLAPAAAKSWFEGAWSHFHASGNGLQEPPSEEEPCQFLVFEDFGTSGLSGDPEQAFDRPGSRNNFFYFFRAEGRSAKGESDRGRWGVGKHVFPRSSRASSFFGMTVRAEDSRRLLMGRSILKSHALGGRHFTPDGYLGHLRDDGLVLPLDSRTELERFASDFDLHRGDEPGLSIVVPFIDREFREDHLISGVIRDYFYPILQGNLSVIVDSRAGEVEINAQTLVDVALSLNGEQAGDLLNLVDLAEWYVSRGRSEVVDLLAADANRPEWSRSLIPPDAIANLRLRLDKGERVSVRSRLTVRKKGNEPRLSHFDVCLKQDGHESGRPVFMREGIIISDVKAPRTRGVRALVFVEDKPLATLLGDSENPAHTQWQRDSSNFRGKYVYGKSFIEFVSRAPYEIVTSLRADEETEDRSLLLDLFSLPTVKSDLPRPEPRPERDKGGESETDRETIEPRRKRFRIQRVAGGFSVTRGDAGTRPPTSLRIRVAYDVRRGQPLKKYDPADFRLDRGPIRFDPPLEGMVITSARENEIHAAVTGPDFRLTVVGFDERRDLFVQVTMTEGSDAEEA